MNKLTQKKEIPRMKITFVYTNNVTYKATNVTSIEQTAHTIEYRRFAEEGSVVGFDVRSVPKDDLLYAVVKDDDGIVSIIPGIYDHFNIVPVGAAVTRQQSIENEAARIAADRAAKAPARQAKEAAKYEARRAARKAQYLGTEVQVKTAPPQSVVSKLAAVAVSIASQLPAYGFTDTDIAVIRSINSGATTNSTDVVTRLAQAAVSVEYALSSYGFTEAEIAEIRTIASGATASEPTVLVKLVQLALQYESVLSSYGFTSADVATIHGIVDAGEVTNAVELQVIQKLVVEALKHVDILASQGFTDANIKDLRQFVPVTTKSSNAVVVKLAKTAQQVNLSAYGFSSDEIAAIRTIASTDVVRADDSAVVQKLVNAAVSLGANTLRVYGFSAEEISEVVAQTSTDTPVSDVIAKLVQVALSVEDVLYDVGFDEHEIEYLRSGSTEKALIAKLVSAALDVEEHLPAYGFSPTEIAELKGQTASVTTSDLDSESEEVVQKLVSAALNVVGTLADYGFNSADVAVLRRIEAGTASTDEPVVTKLVTAAVSVEDELAAYGFTDEDLTVLRSLNALK